MQTTIKAPVTLAGIGLHSGRPARVTIRPAAAEYGIWFHRLDAGELDALVPALWDAVAPSELCTRITNPDGVSVSTVEHVMAALAGLGVTNAVVEIDGPEVPILDGSAAPFVRAIRSRGLRRLTAPLRAVEVIEPVEVTNGAARARLDPAPGLQMDFAIDFADAAIGRQSLSLDLGGATFVHELADCRTFCRQADVDWMRARGLIRGGTLANAVVVAGERVLSPGGLRRPDEAVRHKMLDALGDLALTGAPLLARYAGERAGHALTNALLHALFARPQAYRMVRLDAERAAGLPGASADPARALA